YRIRLLEPIQNLSGFLRLQRTPPVGDKSLERRSPKKEIRHAAARQRVQERIHHLELTRRRERIHLLRPHAVQYVNETFPFAADFRSCAFGRHGPPIIADRSRVRRGPKVSYGYQYRHGAASI